MEKCNYKRIDAEHNVYQCEACGHTALHPAHDI